jgi:hypothetical protein
MNDFKVLHLLTFLSSIVEYLELRLGLTPDLNRVTVNRMSDYIPLSQQP